MKNLACSAGYSSRENATPSSGISPVASLLPRFLRAPVLCDPRYNLQSCEQFAAVCVCVWREGWGGGGGGSRK